jgi:hypothetical protein
LEREQTQQGGRVALRAFSCEFAAAWTRRIEWIGRKRSWRKRSDSRNCSLFSGKGAIAFKTLAIVIVWRYERGIREWAQELSKLNNSSRRVSRSRRKWPGKIYRNGLDELHSCCTI